MGTTEKEFEKYKENLRIETVAKYLFAKTGANLDMAENEEELRKVADSIVDSSMVDDFLSMYKYDKDHFNSVFIMSCIKFAVDMLKKDKKEFDELYEICYKNIKEIIKRGENNK